MFEWLILKTFLGMRYSDAGRIRLAQQRIKKTIEKAEREAREQNKKLKQTQIAGGALTIATAGVGAVIAAPALAMMMTTVAASASAAASAKAAGASNLAAAKVGLVSGAAVGTAAGLGAAVAAEVAAGTETGAAATAAGATEAAKPTIVEGIKRGVIGVVQEAVSESGQLAAAKIIAADTGEERSELQKQLGDQGVSLNRAFRQSRATLQSREIAAKVSFAAAQEEEEEGFQLSPPSLSQDARGLVPPKRFLRKEERRFIRPSANALEDAAASLRTKDNRRSLALATRQTFN